MAKRPSDVHKLAKSIIDELTTEKNPCRGSFGLTRRRMGGKARAENFPHRSEKPLRN